MNPPPQTFDIYESGELCVIGFGNRDPLELSVPDCQQEINRLTEEAECKKLAVDLTGVTLIASGMLGLLASVAKSGIDVMLFNPSEDIIEVLEITNLNRMITSHHVEV
ncbi:STAS domain-containing protein [Calycomorphotria hydatis]|uniref:STAS domain-containing protein n=1 Tax=Calycomorphotria hydatis TaxID=2528027 RepID=A0A517T6R4_9PLAN|nr:STAS domain-containing protein [Calycomorphotria hydatis]QDT64061.1 hypothetical protein V22_12910 [Calycomorphotria hydatis]